MNSIDEIIKYNEKQAQKRIIVQNLIETKGQEKNDKYKPKYLYKYYSPTIQNLEAVEDDNVWISTPRFFNDPYDCSPILDSDFYRAISFKKSDTKNMKTFINNTDKKIEEINELLTLESTFDKFETTESLAIMIHKALKKSLISCYSEINNSVLMWSHYANNHTGFCVEYKFEDVQKVMAKDYDVILIPVIYGDKKEISMDSFLKSKTLNNLEFLCSKSFDWIYEQEWRIIFLSKKEEIERGHLIQGPKANRIILGNKANRVTENYINKICEDKHLGLDKIGLDIHKYNLIINKIK